jgi:predicted DNA-binding transcriptional regulator AlpA
MTSTPHAGIRGAVPSRAVAWLELDIVRWQRRQVEAAGGDPNAIPVPVATRFLRRREVQARTGLSCSTIYRFMAQGKFPRAIAIDGRRQRDTCNGA